MLESVGDYNPYAYNPNKYSSVSSMLRILPDNFPVVLQSGNKVWHPTGCRQVVQPKSVFRVERQDESKHD